jgi:hypothetical protein
MGYADEFYTVLRSDDSMSYFPSNNTSDFYVRLPHTMDLHGDWCVGVNEIWVTKHWYNIRDEYIELSLGAHEYERWPILSGYYDNDQLLGALNSIADNASEGCVTFTYNIHSNRVYIATRPLVKIRLSPHLGSILGVGVDEVITGSWASGCVMDVHKHDRVIYVHCDMITGQLFSDNILPVVKVLDTSQVGFGQVVHDNILSSYADVYKKTFDVIHIEMRDAAGKHIKFEGGHAVIQLHFRRRQ